MYGTNEAYPNAVILIPSSDDWRNQAVTLRIPCSGHFERNRDVTSMIQDRRASVGRRSVAKLLTSRSHQEQLAPILQPTPQAERPPVSGGPRYVFGFKPVRRLWLVDDGCKGAGQFGGANSLTHGDEQLVCCSIGLVPASEGDSP